MSTSNDTKVITLANITTYDTKIKELLNNKLDTVVFWDELDSAMGSIEIPGSEINDTTTATSSTWSSDKIEKTINIAVSDKADVSHTHQPSEVGALPAEDILNYFPQTENVQMIQSSNEYPKIQVFGYSDGTLYVRLLTSATDYKQIRISSIDDAYYDIITGGETDSQPMRCLALNGTTTMRAPIKIKNSESCLGSTYIYKNHSETADYGTTIKDFDNDSNSASITISALDNALKFTKTDGTIHTVYGTHNLSTADTSSLGLNKLYTSKGTATDGTLTQKAVNDYYLAKTGGTISGPISTSLSTNTYLAGNQGTAIINSTANAGAYVMLAKMNSTNGVFTHGTYQGKYELHYTNNDTITAGTNAVTYNATLLDESGNTSFPGNVTFKNSTDYATSRGRNIKASTSDLTAGSSSLANGSIYLVYE